MGCGCKKRRLAAQQAATQESEVQSTPGVNEQRDYQLKVRDALKQFAHLKRKKQNLRGR